MKFKISILILTAAAIVIFLGASPWEGAASVAPEGELPAAGYYVATNSFPRNTVVDITNIENNRSTRAIVAGGLESPGLLAIVSREAAELIGLRAGSVGRIRMVQPSDPIAYMRFTEGLNAGIPQYDSGNVITEGNYNDIYSEDTYRPSAIVEEPIKEPVIPPPITGPGYFLEPEWRTEIVDLPGYDDPAPFPDNRDYVSELAYPQEIVEEPEEIWEEFAELEEIVEEPYEEEPVYIVEEPVETEEPAYDDFWDFVLVPTEEKPPEQSVYGIDLDDIIPSITKEPEPESAPVTVVPDRSFSVPRISELNSGSYYVQIAALDSPESVESTISKIDLLYNPIIYNAGDRWYRILLGPLNQGESAAILARFKSIGYKDAFVRHAR